MYAMTVGDECCNAWLDVPKLVTVSNTVVFSNPKAPFYPRLAQGKSWNKMMETWTSDYGLDEAKPFVEWGPKEGVKIRSPDGTLIFDHDSICVDDEVAAGIAGEFLEAVKRDLVGIFEVIDDDELESAQKEMQRRMAADVALPPITRELFVAIKERVRIGR
ncbi:hypothetical protein Drorol1_Dr00020551 [Drosera rotundifolia]